MEPNRRILVVDADPKTQQAYSLILRSGMQFFGASSMFTVPGNREFAVDCSGSGAEALEKLRAATGEGQPYSVAFIDLVLPDVTGLELATYLWNDDPALEIVLVANDPRVPEVAAQNSQLATRMLVLNKPFEPIEVYQLAKVLAERWVHRRVARQYQLSLERQVEERTAKLRDANERLMAEMAERSEMEVALRHAQKLEAVGRLAAGIAHEINTPIQYTGDSVHFIQGACDDLLGFVGQCARVLDEADPSAPVVRHIQQAWDQAAEEADLGFVVQELPEAFRRALDGIERVAGIVKAMKEFSHPERGEQAPADLNHALEATAVVARNEYKYVAQIAFDLGDLPPVNCYLSDLNQVFLNLIVNAAHAIAEAGGNRDEPGKIVVKTRKDGDRVQVAIADTGNGVPVELRRRIFEPFFTTKEVGQGTGQGLALARQVVVEKHKGSIRYLDNPGGGACFVITLPVAGAGKVDRHTGSLARVEPGPAPAARPAATSRPPAVPPPLPPAATR